MDDVGLVQTVLDLTGLRLLHGLGGVGGHGAGLGGWHQTLGAQHLTQTADDTHHVGGGDDDVEVEPILLLDLLDQIHLAHIVGAGGLGSLGLVALGEHQHADGLTGTVGQHDGAADLLVGVTGVNTQLDVELDGLIELSAGSLADQLQTLLGIIQRGLIDLLGAFLILLTSKHRYTLLTRRRQRPWSGRYRRSCSWLPQETRRSGRASSAQRSSGWRPWRW